MLAENYFFVAFRTVRFARFTVLVARVLITRLVPATVFFAARLVLAGAEVFNIAGNVTFGSDRGIVF